MWGTIARMQLRPDVPADYLAAQMRALNPQYMGGFLFSTFYRSEENPRELWMVAMFEDEAAYRANAESTTQNAVYETMRACLDADPEWHDVDEVWSIGAPLPGSATEPTEG